MHLSVSRRPQASVVSVDGEFLGALHGAEFRETLGSLQAAGSTRVVLDLRACGLMDSAGLGVLIDVAAALRAAGGDLRVVVREGRLRRLFEMTGLLGRVFAVYATIEEALAGWETSPGEVEPAV